MTGYESKIYEQKKYFAVALDPIHIGTGGYRIGRVDNTIVREPATGIPKIPGTTIEGVCRSYAFLRIMENENLREELRRNGFNQQCAKGKVKKEGDKKVEPCGKCPICITFGYAADTKSLQAMALFSDARILFFPVATMIGPVWVTCPMILRDAGIEEDAEDAGIRKFDEPENGKFIANLNVPENKLNFGWLLLEKDSAKSINPQSWGLPINNNILKRIVIVSDELFSTIVNSNLEVRTSVAIDPERGAAEEGALFTYEAIPRGTVFWFDVVYQNPKNFPALSGLKLRWDDKEIEIKEDTKDIDLFSILKSCVQDGLSLFEHLGVGGMGSRGFGRLKVLESGDSDGSKK